MNKYIIILFCLISVQGYSKEKYTITQYKIDKVILDSAFTLCKGGQYKKAETVLNHYKSKINSTKYYLQAKINYHLNKPFESQLNKAFILGSNHVDSSHFYLENKSLIDDGITTQLKNLTENKAKQLFKELQTADQKYRADDISPGSRLDKELLIKFDSLITIYGWPCSSQYQFNGIGPVILLAQQDFVNQDLLMKYYYQVVELCLDNKEDWTVADFILNQRFQWFGSKLRHPEITSDTVTLKLDKDVRFDKSYTYPIFYLMSKKLVNGSRYKLEITVSKDRFRSEIKDLIYLFEEIIVIPDEVKHLMEKDGFSIPTPKGLTDDRFSIQVNPGLKENELVYQFVNN